MHASWLHFASHALLFCSVKDADTLAEIVTPVIWLRTGPGGLLRLSTGLSYAALVAGAVVLALQVRPPLILA